MTPLTLLTGFLGAGKTTLLNRILTGRHDRRIAVIVNEFGDVGIDGALVAEATGDVVELANGCICCATRGQLLKAVHAVLEVSPPPEAILVETSGLADPFPVLSELAHSSLVERVEVDGVLTLVDADNFDRNLDSAEAAFHQIVAADILLVNKVDLVADEIPRLIEGGLRRLNPGARVLFCVGGDVPLPVLVGDQPAPAPGAPAAIIPRHAAHRHDPDHDGFEAITLTPPDRVDAARLSAWLEALPANVFRAKGFVRLARPDARVGVSAVGTRHALSPTPTPPRTTVPDVLVVIGQALDSGALAAGLAECRA